MRLLGEERRAALKVERLFLEECDTAFRDLVPNLHHCGNVSCFVCVDFGLRASFRGVGFWFPSIELEAGKGAYRLPEDDDWQTPLCISIIEASPYNS